jgi:hypothetical protein
VELDSVLANFDKRVHIVERLKKSVKMPGLLRTDDAHVFIDNNENWYHHGYLIRQANTENKTATKAVTAA